MAKIKVGDLVQITSRDMAEFFMQGYIVRIDYLNEIDGYRHPFFIRLKGTNTSFAYARNEFRKMAGVKKNEIAR